MASLYDIGFNPRTMFIDEEGQIRLKDPEASEAMLAANEPTFDLNNYIMSTAAKKQNNEPVFSNPGEAEIEPTASGNYESIDYGNNNFDIMQFLPFGEKSVSGAIMRGIGSLVPKRDPRQTALDSFYTTGEGAQYMNPNSQSYIPGMENYNTVSGGLLNMLTGGKFGEPTNYGLQRSYDKRRDTIENTLTREGGKYGLSQDDIDAIYAGTYDEESDDFDTTLIQRLRNLKAAQDKELQVLQDAQQTGGTTTNFINTKDNYSGDESIPSNVTAAGGTYDGGYQAQEGGFEFTGDQPGTSDQGYTDSGDFAGLKKGGLVSIL